MIDFNRYLVIQVYFGKFDDVTTICACQSIGDANMIAQSLSDKFKDRPFRFTVKKVATDYIDFLDEENFSLFGDSDV